MRKVKCCPTQSHLAILSILRLTICHVNIFLARERNSREVTALSSNEALSHGRADCSCKSLHNLPVYRKFCDALSGTGLPMFGLTSDCTHLSADDLMTSSRSLQGCFGAHLFPDVRKARTECRWIRAGSILITLRERGITEVSSSL